MHIVRDVAAFSPEWAGASLAIGNFDGLHAGHRAVIDAARTVADARNVPLAVMTFEPHPRTVFKPDNPVFRLTPEPMKIAVLDMLGVDVAVIFPFSRAFSSQSADAFVDDILVRGLKVGHVATGYDFHFGHKRQGTPEFLVKSGRDAGFGVSIVEAYTGASGEPIASSIIREALADGDLDLVHRQLGYRYTISATVIHGDKRGRDLGYPTANMILQSESTLKYGVYAVRVRTADGVHAGVANFGRRPQYDNGSILLEAHLFDYAGDLYGADIEVEFVAYLRAEMSFDGVNALIAQMDRDSARSRDILDGIKGTPFGPDALRSVAL